MQQAQPKKIALPRAERRRRVNWDRLTPVLMIAPSLVALAVFVYGFIGWTGWVSVSNWRGLNPDFSWVGLDNYGRVFGTARFQTDIRNTVVFTIFFLAGCVGLGLLLAMLVDSKIKGAWFFRSVFLFPMALSFIVTGTVWQWLFVPGTTGQPSGLNALLQHLGLPFFQDWSISADVMPGWQLDLFKTRLGLPLAMLPVLAAAIWQLSGFTMALYLAGLRGINEELYEAARTDGATEIQLFRFIKWPLLQPVTLSALIILGHISLKIFDLVITQTGGGPGNATDMPGINMYQLTFKSNRYGDGAAIAVIMLLLVAALVVPYLRHIFRPENDQ